MNEPKPGHFEGWAIVELMGHQQEIGFVTTEAYGQAVLFRVDTPELPEREFVLTQPEWDGETLPAGSKVKRSGSPARTRLIAPGSLYAINPCTEEAAREALESRVHRKLILIEKPAKAVPALAASRDYDPVDDYDDINVSLPLNHDEDED